MKARSLIREAMNLDSGKGVILFVKSIFVTTVIFELTGAALSFLVFVQDYPPLHAAGISLFHSVAAFNNSGSTSWATSRTSSPTGTTCC